MSVAGRVGFFVAGLAALFGAAFAAGGAIDPDVEEGAAPAHADGSPPAHAGDDHGGGGNRSGDAAAPARIVVARSALRPGQVGTLVFRVVDRRGRTIDDFDVEHDRAMHLIAVRRDLTGYRHVHPRRAADGAWTVDVAFAGPGPQRLYADFVSDGRPYTLSADVEVAGDYRPRPLPAPATVAQAGDGYAVSVSRHGGERRFAVTRDGRPVDDIEPYLGARGHLVAISERELRFQHVHPKDGATEGRQIRFDVELPKPGAYRLFLQFKHDGEVRTAAFTERVTTSGAAHGEDGHGH